MGVSDAHVMVGWMLEAEFADAAPAKIVKPVLVPRRDGTTTPMLMSEITPRVAKPGDADEVICISDEEPADAKASDTPIALPLSLPPGTSFTVASNRSKQEIETRRRERAQQRREGGKGSCRVERKKKKKQNKNKLNNGKISI